MANKFTAFLAGLLNGGPVAPSPPSPGLAMVTARPEVLEGAFQSGFTVLRKGKPVGFQVESLGTVRISSGAIVAADPFYMGGYSSVAYTTPVPVGDHPVDVAFAVLPDQVRVALARVRFSEKSAVRWEMALSPGNDPRDLEPGEVFTFDVDAGTAAFGDPAAFDWLQTVTDGQGEELMDGWLSEGEANSLSRGYPHRLLLNTPTGPGNLVMFSSGWGDGAYAAWFGFDAEGEVAALVIDFAVVTAVCGVPEADS